MFFGSQGFIDFKMWVARKKVWETLHYMNKLHFKIAILNCNNIV